MKIKIMMMLSFLMLLFLFSCGMNTTSDTIILNYTLDGTSGPHRITAPCPIIAGSIRLYHDDIGVGYDIDRGDGTGRLVDTDGTNNIIDASSLINYAGYTDAIVISYVIAPINGTILKISFNPALCDIVLQ
jgi:hypothetical protein